MPYDENLEARIAVIVSPWNNTGSKKMFGGICHLLRGNMFCGVYKEFLILRLSEENAETALKEPFVRPFDITGRPMKGWVMVEPGGIGSDNALNRWLDQARDFAGKLPAK